MAVQMNNGANPGRPQQRSAHQQARSQPQAEPEGNSNRPPRSEASPGTPRSAQRPAQSIGAPKVQGRQIAAWGKTCFAVTFWSLAAVGLILTLLYCTVVNLLPPWVWAFNEMAKLVTANLELYPRTVFWILGFSTVVAVIAYTVVQGYQSAGQLKKHFGILLPAKSTFDELRNYSYGVEAFINFTFVYGKSVNGWSGNMFGDGAKLLGYVLSSPIKAIIDLLWIALQTMLSEIMIGLACLAIVAALQAIRANAGVAAKQSAVTSARPQQWSDDRGNQRPADRTVDVGPTKSAEPAQPETKKQQEREQKASYSHGEFFQDQQGIWKYMDIKGGVSRARIAKEGESLDFASDRGMEKYKARWGEDSQKWAWCPIMTPQAPAHAPRPERRAAAEKRSAQPATAPNAQDEMLDSLNKIPETIGRQPGATNPSPPATARPPRRPR